MKRHFLYNPKTKVKRKKWFLGRWLGRETMAMEGCKEKWQPRIRRNLLSREVKLVHLVSRVTGPFLFSELLELCTTMCKSYILLQLPESLGMAVHMKYLGLLSYRKSNWEAEGESSIPNEPSIMGMETGPGTTLCIGKLTVQLPEDMAVRSLRNHHAQFSRLGLERHDFLSVSRQLP